MAHGLACGNKNNSNSMIKILMVRIYKIPFQLGKYHTLNYFLQSLTNYRSYAKLSFPCLI